MLHITEHMFLPNSTLTCFLTHQLHYGSIKTDVLYKSLDVFIGNKDINHVISSRIREICIARPTIPLEMGLSAAFPFTKSKDSLFQ